MAKSNYKQVVVGVMLLGFLAWNASIQFQVNSAEDEDPLVMEARGKVSFNEHIAEEVVPRRSRRKRSADQESPAEGDSSGDVGAVYIRWGRKECPNLEAELVYSGIAGSSRHNETGGSTEYLCMPHHPQYAKYTDKLEGSGKLYGVEFETGTAAILENNGPSGSLQNADVMCAVCRARGRTSSVMIPGRKSCFPGWRPEYWGYVMTSHYGHRAQFNYACVDATARGAERGSTNDNGGLMYHVQGFCGSLSCPRYVQGRELTCVVCTK